MNDNNDSNITAFENRHKSRELVNSGPGNSLIADHRRFGEVNDDMIDLSQILRNLVRYKYLIIAITILSLLLTYTANMMMRPIYDSNTVIKINQNRNILKYSSLNNVGGNNQHRFVPTQISLLKSKKISQRVIELLHLDENPEFTGEMNQRGFVNGAKEIFKLLNGSLFADSTDKEEPSYSIANVNQDLKFTQIMQRFASRLSVEQVQGTDLVKINFSSFDPQLSATIANTIVDAYRLIDEETQVTIKNQAQIALEKKLKEVQQKLEESDRQLTAFSRETGTVDLEDRGNLVTRKLEILNEEYLNAQSERISYESRYKQNTELSENLILTSVLEDEVINQMKKQKAQLLSEYRRLTQIYQPNYPTVKQLQLDIAELNKNIGIKAKEHVFALETKVAAAQYKEKLLKRELEKQNTELLDIKDSAIEYNHLKREWESNKELYAGLLERVKQSGISSDLELTRLSIIDKARTPLAPSSPNVTKNTLTAGLIGLIFAFGLAGLFGLLDRRIRTPDDLKTILTYPNLSVTPRIPKTANGEKIEVLSKVKPSQHFAETFRSLRTSLTYSLAGGFPDTIMVTSSLPSEAKTTTIVNLALTLQQNDQKVLLLDLDLRKPRLHKVFNIALSPGVTDCIVLKDLTMPIYESKEYGVSVIPSGTPTQNPVELLESAEFNKLLTKLKKDYDVILIDSPPVMGLADALVIATKVNSVLMAVAADIATIDSVKNSVSRLEAVGAHLIGTLMTKFDLEKENYYTGVEYYQYQYTNDKNVVMMNKK